MPLNSAKAYKDLQKAFDEIERLVDEEGETFLTYEEIPKRGGSVVYRIVHYDPHAKAPLHVDPSLPERPVDTSGVEPNRA